MVLHWVWGIEYSGHHSGFGILETAGYWRGTYGLLAVAVR